MQYKRLVDLDGEMDELDELLADQDPSTDKLKSDEALKKFSWTLDEDRFVLTNYVR